jgi:hypothetical protein
MICVMENYLSVIMGSGFGSPLVISSVIQSPVLGDKRWAKEPDFSWCHIGMQRWVSQSQNKVVVVDKKEIKQKLGKGKTSLDWNLNSDV